MNKLIMEIETVCSWDDIKQVPTTDISSPTRRTGIEPRKRWNVSSIESDEVNNTTSEDELSSKFKKFRLTKTPGELRFHKDLQELKDIVFPHCNVKQIDSSSAYIIISDYHSENSNSSSTSHSSNIDVSTIITSGNHHMSHVVPIGDPILYRESKFIVSISTYYPHTKPMVKCIEDYGNKYIHQVDADHRIFHPILADWSPIRSIKDIVIMLLSIIKEEYKTIVDSQLFLSNNLEQVSSENMIEDYDIP